MPTRLFLSIIVSLTLLLASCVDEEQHPNTPQGNFEALWTIIDQHYCFFNDKHINWDSIHNAYAPRISSHMSQDQLFEVLSAMLANLKDGHVNLYSTFNTGRYWAWHEDHPQNFSDSLLRRYLGTNYAMASGMKYRTLDDNIGYVYYPAFATSISSGSIDDMLLHFAPCRALIIDVRNNGGGSLDTARELASHFTNTPTLVGYQRHKTGSGHADFSSMQAQTIEPSHGIRWQKPVVLLTNRSVYSAANEFVKYMMCFPSVQAVGDSTGGGAGMPFMSELPNGWAVRFSAMPMYNREGQTTEWGIAPTYRVNISSEDYQRGTDTIIEYARRLIAKGSSSKVLHP